MTQLREQASYIIDWSNFEVRQTELYKRCHVFESLWLRRTLVKIVFDVWSCQIIDDYHIEGYVDYGS